MARRLTEGQKRARAVIKATVRKMLAELDEWRDDEYVEFKTWFHLDCIRYTGATYMGQPLGQNWPIFKSESRDR